MLGVCLALIYAINLSTPNLLDRAGNIKGTDFMHFYVLGSLALNGPAAALYDYAAQMDLSARLIPESSGVFYLPIYGPQVSLLFAPFATLPYMWALVIWALHHQRDLRAVLLGIWKTCRHLRHEGATVAILAAASPAFFNLRSAWTELRHRSGVPDRRFLRAEAPETLSGGAGIGTLIYKPQLGLVVACVFVVSREWRSWRGLYSRPPRSWVSHGYHYGARRYERILAFGANAGTSARSSTPSLTRCIRCSRSASSWCRGRTSPPASMPPARLSESSWHVWSGELARPSPCAIRSYFWLPC